jgi:hypothetical protein
MPKRLTSGQGWPVGRPRSGCGAQGTLSSRFFFCDERAPTQGAALFGYFLALLPKSDPPVGGNPRLQIGKAERRVTLFAEGDIPYLRRCAQRTLHQLLRAPRQKLDSRLRGNDEWNVAKVAQNFGLRHQILRCAQDDSQKQKWMPACAGMTGKA